VSQTSDFIPPIDDTVENEFASWDYSNILKAGVTLTSIVSVTCTDENRIDLNPAARLLSAPVIVASPSTARVSAAVSVLFGTAVGGAYYKIQCVAQTSDGQQLSLYTRWQCNLVSAD